MAAARTVLTIAALALSAATPASAQAHHHQGWGQPWPDWSQPADVPVDDPGADDPADDQGVDPTEPAELGPVPVQQLFPNPTVNPNPLPGTGTVPGQPQVPGVKLPQVPQAPKVELVRTATVPGPVAKLRSDGRAAIPSGAPQRVRTLIAAMNRIVGKPYKWGGGHARLIDRGYDCSGAVSYGLIGAGMLSAPQVSGTLARWGAKGRGRWVTVYANRGHVYLEVAGLRLDTSPVGDQYGSRMGVRWRSLIGKRRGFAVRHPAGF